MAKMAFVALMFGALSFTGCGPIEVHGAVDPIKDTVSGTVTIQVSVAAYLPYLLKICRSASQDTLCYNSDPNICGVCLMQGLENSLGVTN